MEEYSIEHTTITTKAMAERGIETVKTLWREMKDKLRALLAYRTTPLESLARPYELLMDRKIRNNIPCMNRLIFVSGARH